MKTKLFTPSIIPLHQQKTIIFGKKGTPIVKP